MNRPILVVVVAALLLPVQARAGESVGSALLDVHSLEVFDYGVPLGWIFMSKDWSVTTDGSLTSIVRYGQRDGGFGPAVLSRMLKSPGDLFSQLTRSLSTAHIGSLAGNCSPWQPEPGASHRYEITWYGKHGRRNHLVIDDGFATPCPPEVSPLLDMLFYFEKVLTDPNLPI